MKVQLSMKASFKNRNLIRITFAGLILMGFSLSYAETWVEVGNNIYADKDSVTRTGEIAHITITDMSKVGLDTIKFDCKRNIAFYRGFNEPRNTKENAILLKTQELACRRSWELWK
jgi:hypothetical protein